MAFDGPIRNQLLQSVFNGSLADGGVGCFCTLRFRNIDQLIQYGGLPFQIQLLPALMFIDLRYQTENLRIPLL